MEEIDVFEKIFGWNINTLKGKTVHTNPKEVVNE